MRGGSNGFLKKNERGDRVITLVSSARGGQRESRRPVRPVSGGSAGEKRCCHRINLKKLSSLCLSPCQRLVAILCRGVLTSHLPPRPPDARGNPGFLDGCLAIHTTAGLLLLLLLFRLSLSLCVCLCVPSTSEFNFIQTKASVRTGASGCVCCLYSTSIHEATEQQQQRLQAGSDRTERIRKPVFPSDRASLPLSFSSSPPSSAPTNGEAGGGGSEDQMIWVWCGTADLPVTRQRSKQRSTEDWKCQN